MVRAGEGRALPARWRSRSSPPVRQQARARQARPESFRDTPPPAARPGNEHNPLLAGDAGPTRRHALLGSIAAGGEDAEQLSVHDSDSQADGDTPTILAVLDTITRQQLALVITTYRVRSDSRVHRQSAAVGSGSGCRGCPCGGQARSTPAVFAGAGWCRRPGRRRRRTAIGSFPLRTAPGTATRTRRLGAAASGGCRLPLRVRRR